MSQVILGLTGFYLEPAAALIVEGRLAAAFFEDEVASRSAAGAFPSQAVARCLSAAGLGPSDVGYIGFGDKPRARFRRVVETGVQCGGRSSFSQSLLPWLRTRLHVASLLRAEVAPNFQGAILFAEHHEALAAAAYFASPWSDAAFMSLDGIGEYAAGAIGIGQGNRINITHQARFPHGLGVLHSACCLHLGLNPAARTDPLTPWANGGSPRFRDRLLRDAVELRTNGSIYLRPTHFDFSSGGRLVTPNLDRLFEGTSPSTTSHTNREPDQRERDVAASVLAVIEEAALRTAQYLRQQHARDHLVVAGMRTPGWLARVHGAGIFANVWTPPATAASSAAAGAAWLVHHHVLGAPRVPASARAAEPEPLGALP
ncbi:MAG TPA: carbamoyltransferase N-terminal domain-containing protein [Gemmatales bacterium]|nr:carbamoyltransferase N-terminal domain-containing protein [Gemmatales bacterium]HMP60385.1 carbamoyltransferase N-terminal domain-containing protein [Gemmatales bacterium]